MTGDLLGDISATRQRAEMLRRLGVRAVSATETLHRWRLSSVERLHLPGGGTVIFKHAQLPFTGERHVLADLHRQGLPVPRIVSAQLAGGMLGMLLEDLGQPQRKPSDSDAAAVAVQLHAAIPPGHLPVLDAAALAALPGEALAYLDDLTSGGRYTGADDVREHLAALRAVAIMRADGAGRPPFGLCHGELHPTAIHIGSGGRRVLDLATALHGPGLLDLAAWFGLRQPPDLPRTRNLIRRYVAVGGHPAALTERGGLAAEQWALGWHRVQAAHWLLGCAVAGIDGADLDHRNIGVLRRQLAAAVDLLGAG